MNITQISTPALHNLLKMAAIDGEQVSPEQADRYRQVAEELAYRYQQIAKGSKAQEVMILREV